VLAAAAFVALLLVDIWLVLVGGTAALVAVYGRRIALPRGPARVHWSQTVFGHRGCRRIKGTPENTLAAFPNASWQKATGIEFDVRLCRSGELVVFHDATITPTMRPHKLDDHVPPHQRREYVSDFTLAELRSMAFAEEEIDDEDEHTSWQAGGKSKLLTLDEAFAYCRAAKLRILVELKHFDVWTLHLVVKECVRVCRANADYMNHVIVIGFNPLLMYMVRRAAPEIPVGVLHDGHMVTDALECPDDVRPPPYLAAIFRVWPRGWDALAEAVNYRLAPWLCGASMVGTHVNNFDSRMRARWLEQKVLLYLWGISKVTHICQLHGVAVSCDDNHAAHLPKH